MEAIYAYRESLRLDPGNTDVRVDMGTCYRNSGKPLEAVNAYRTALKYDQGHLLARKNLGIVLAYDLGKIEEAIHEFETYLNLAPDAPDAKQIKQALRELRERLSG
jgi:tetratricopeptide (TPR) repeat protein